MAKQMPPIQYSLFSRTILQHLCKAKLIYCCSPSIYRLQNLRVPCKTYSKLNLLQIPIYATFLSMCMHMQLKCESKTLVSEFSIYLTWCRMHRILPYDQWRSLHFCFLHLAKVSASSWRFPTAHNASSQWRKTGVGLCISASEVETLP